MEEFIVDTLNIGKRLDSYLSESTDKLSRTMIKKIIDTDGVLVNDKIEKASYKVQLNDKIKIEIHQ